jgi:hypothetical protein
MWARRMRAPPEGVNLAAAIGSTLEVGSGADSASDETSTIANKALANRERPFALNLFVSGRGVAE